MLERSSGVLIWINANVASSESRQYKVFGADSWFNRDHDDTGGRQSNLNAQQPTSPNLTTHLNQRNNGLE